MNRIAAGDGFVGLTENDVEQIEDIIPSGGYKKVRKGIKNLIKSMFGDDVYFSIGNSKIVARITSRAAEHYALYATKEKAALTKKFAELIKKSRYSYSSHHDEHLEGEYNKATVNNWDYFVSAVKYKDELIPVVFSVRSIDEDVRAQVYSIAAGLENNFGKKVEAVTTHEDAIRYKSESRRSIYGRMAASNNGIISQTVNSVNTQKHGGRSAISNEEYWETNELNEERDAIRQEIHEKESEEYNTKLLREGGVEAVTKNAAEIRKLEKKLAEAYGDKERKVRAETVVKPTISKAELRQNLMRTFSTL